MKPDINDVIDRLENLENHFLFTYQGRKCGIDPISKTHYDMWFGETSASAKSVEDAFSSKIWGGKDLSQIFDIIEIISY